MGFNSAFKGLIYFQNLKGTFGVISMLRGTKWLRTAKNLVEQKKSRGVSPPRLEEICLCLAKVCRVA